MGRLCGDVVVPLELVGLCGDVVVPLELGWVGGGDMWMHSL